MMSSDAEPTTSGNRPTIPAEELRSRPRSLGAALAEQGVDGWIAYGSDGEVAGPSHIRYLCNFQPHFEPVLLAARADQERAVMLTGPESIGYAAVITAPAGIAEILPISEMAHPDEEYPTMSLVQGADTLADLLGTCRRVGILGADAIPYPLFQHLMAPLLQKGTELVPADDVAYRLRAVKTPHEQAVVCEAYRIAKIGMEAAATAIRPGAIEREVAAEAEVVMRRAGAEGFGIDTMVASGIANTSPILARSTFRTIEEKDLVTVTLAPRYEGYHSALARAFLFRPNPEVERAIEAAKGGQRAALSCVATGAEGRVGATALKEFIDSTHTGAEVPYVGIHSVGCIEFEPPIFMSTSDARIADGMTLSVDAPLFHAPWGGLRLEDGFVVRDGAPVPQIDSYEDMVPIFL